jgi:hypothetical protein
LPPFSRILPNVIAAKRRSGRAGRSDVNRLPYRIPRRLAAETREDTVGTALPSSPRRGVSAYAVVLPFVVAPADTALAAPAAPPR